MEAQIECPVTRLPLPLGRRGLLKGAVAAAAVALLAACGGEASAPVAATPGATATAVPAATMAATSATAAGGPAMPTAGSANVTTIPAAPRAAPKGALTVALNQGFPTKLDPTKTGNVTLFALAETLSHLMPDGTVAPMLAESVTNVNPTTWRVTLRAGVKFWDGSTLTADDVIAAFRKDWEANPDTNGLIAKDSKVTAIDARTVEFVTPQQTGIFPNALTLPLFSIHKPSAPGASDGMMLTGPYKPTKFVVDNELDLEPFTGYWGGTPPIATITARNIADVNARVLALQSGDINALYLIPPDATTGLGDGFDVLTIPSGRVHYLVYNVNRPPFNDRAVREATTIALDRVLLNTVALQGKGTVADGMFPPNLGFDVVPFPGTDVNRAKQLLDATGWTTGPDGVRIKDGKRLSFPIYTFNGRPELPLIAVGVQDQLKKLGYEIPQVMVSDQSSFTSTTKKGDWDAAVFSNDAAPSGDPLYCFNRLIAKGGGNNLADYSHPRSEQLIAQLRMEINPIQRQVISRQIQEVVKADFPAAFLVIPPLITVFKKGLVRGYTPHPSDAFFITPSMSIA